MTTETTTTAPHAPPLARRDSRAPDPAWENDTVRTNYALKTTDSVSLLADTKGDFSAGYFTVPAGTKGVVVNARTPRVCTKPGTKSPYFANVDVTIEGIKGRIRVPHGALRRITK